ncbi:MAG TPA: hypothetical protein VHC22_32105 [Pirellulales bacterium]|nr:hypothetical protein [Pirellulales bacterium]
MQCRPRLIMGLAICLALAVHPASAGEPAKRLYTKDTRFWVRFQLPTLASTKDVPREVELHVSSDHGATWEVAGAAKPADRKILFNAPADGEYAFMPRTKYTSGRYLPEGPPSAELTVVVDTTPPALDLDARHDGDEVVIRWQVSDANLKPETFKLEYRPSAPNAKWQQVAVDAVATPRTPDSFSGETTVVLPILEQVSTIVIRAEVSDEAGNHTVKEQPLAAGPGAEPGDPNATDTPPDMPAAFSNGTESVRQPAENPPYPRTATPDWPADESPALAGDWSARNETVLPPSGRNLRSASFRPPMERLRDLPEVRRETEASGDAFSLPPGVKPHLVDKPRFELRYDVDAIGSAGVVQVELWMTTDYGRTWKSYGLDDDCRSPVLVNVRDEAVYGFRVVVETTAGLRSPAPVRGDLPDVWVEVDLTKPVLRLLSAEQGTDADADRLVICWEANDKHLASRGIALRWSESAQGPWNTIASGLENSGRYAWRLDQRLPRQVYLQLEARDDGGNVATDQLPQPASLERIRPQGRIREVRPVGAAPPSGTRR